MVPGIFLTWALLALTWFDIRQGRLPNVLTLPLCLAGIGFAVLFGWPVADYLLGAVIGFLMPIIIAAAYRHWNDHDGLGGGDIKLLGAVGAWVGWTALPAVLLASSLSALAFMVLTGRLSPRKPIAFGPFIALAAWVTWFCLRQELWS
jgi:prepilin signal peptidase PulO-like enzyme (type II secretory pathway)